MAYKPPYAEGCGGARDVVSFAGWRLLRARHFPGSSSGRTADSGSVNRGSNPRPGATQHLGDWAVSSPHFRGRDHSRLASCPCHFGESGGLVTAPHTECTLARFLRAARCRKGRRCARGPHVPDEICVLLPAEHRCWWSTLPTGRQPPLAQPGDALLVRLRPRALRPETAQADFGLSVVHHVWHVVDSAEAKCLLYDRIVWQGPARPLS